MPVIRVNVTLKGRSGLPEDVVVNVFHCITVASAPAVAAADFVEDLRDFYRVAPEADLLPVGAYLANRLGSDTIAPLGFRAYNLSDPTPRTPILEQDGWGLPARVGSNDLPREVAGCLSFEGERVSGTVRSRRRGRVYIGPLNTGATNSLGELSTGFVASLRGAALDLGEASQASTTYAWGVYSPTTDDEGATPEASFTIIDHGWVDNAVDVQRRRGLRASERAIFDLNP